MDFNIICFIVSSVLGLLIFTKGFLLSRTSLSEKSPVTASIKPKFNRSVFIIIDALRFDFVQHQTIPNQYHHNKLKVIAQELHDRPQNSRLFKFIADPPTTTMQRLKGLTTGSLPTFVDAGSNFASSEIDEDNIIDCLLRDGKQVIFMGDDTWEDLFPGRFVRHYPYPSFNVHDLHTVDRGVKSHLFNEMEKDDWSVLIGHFLGVDHCGHRYGPNHPEMADKLTEMNAVLREIIDKLDSDTLLVILGDHGMTRSGDHGGDSESEVTAALVLYSKTPFLDSELITEEVSQIDLVPTLATLLGTRIPFSNLGSVIPDVFTDPNHRINAFQATAFQISAYLNAYSSVSNDLPLASVARLHEMESQFHKTPEDVERVVGRYQKYINFAKAMCRDIWAKFDDLHMQAGMLLVIFTFILQGALAIDMVESKLTTQVLQVLLTVEVVFLCYLDLTPLYNYIIVSFSFFLMAVYCLRYSSLRVERITISGLNLLTFNTVIFYCVLALSNSFVVHEDAVLLYVTQTAVILLFLRILSNSAVHSGKTKPTRDYFMICTFIILMVILYLSSNFYGCREENTKCEVSSFSKPVASLHPELQKYKDFRLLGLTLPCLFVMIYTLRKIVKARGNANGFSVNSMLIYYGLYFGSISLTLHWIVSTAKDLPSTMQLIFARIVYIIVFFSIFLYYISPLTTHLQLPDKRRPVRVTGNEPTIPDVYRFLQNKNGSPQPAVKPLVFGLSSAYSSPYLVIMAMLFLLMSMLHGDGMVLSTFFMFTCIIILLDVYKVYTRNTGNTFVDAVYYTFILVWVLCSNFFFYASGQQQTMPNIQWDAAFQGFTDHGNHHLIPAILLFSSTFSSQIVFSFLLPLITIVPESGQLLTESLLYSGEQQKTTIGEVSLVYNQEETRKRIVHTASIYLLLHLLKAASSMLAAFILRRHLMVWKIFAPAFVFEGAAFICVCCSTFLGLILFYRINSSVKRFVSNMELEHTS